MNLDYIKFLCFWTFLQEFNINIVTATTIQPITTVTATTTPTVTTTVTTVQTTTPVMTTTPVPTTTPAPSCSLPEGVSNAIITSSGPYYVGTRITYECAAGFSMTGSPSAQICDATLVWSGLPPSCKVIDPPYYYFNIGDGKIPWWAILLLAIILSLFLLALLTMLVMLCCCKQNHVYPNGAGYSSNCCCPCCRRQRRRVIHRKADDIESDIDIMEINSEKRKRKKKTVLFNETVHRTDSSTSANITEGRRSPQVIYLDSKTDREVPKVWIVDKESSGKPQYVLQSTGGRTSTDSSPSPSGGQRLSKDQVLSDQEKLIMLQRRKSNEPKSVQTIWMPHTNPIRNTAYHRKTSTK